ncbi:MAG: TonB family protein [Bacteroidales bacterium]|nr:TonB family protein [Bacteroidales bacterium]
MQHHPNNDIRNIPEEKGKGVAGAIIIHIVLLLVLVFIAFKVPAPPEQEEGIMVNFGTSETGFGMIEPPIMSASAATAPSETQAASVEEVPLLTQNDEEAPEVRVVDPEAEREKREQAETDRKKRAELEAAERQKREEEARIIAEQQRQTEIFNRTRDAFTGARNAATSSNREGDAGGSSNQGATTGSPDSRLRGDGGSSGDGVNYDLGGRKHRGELYFRKLDYKEGGKVVVTISVDQNGNVTSATLGKGSTTLNTDLVNAATEFALKTKFEQKPGAIVEQGTITYNFILN